MSLDDPERKVYSVSSPEDRERLLAEALAHAERQEAQYKQPVAEAIREGRWKAMLSAVVLVMAAYVAIAPPTLLYGPPPPSASPAELLTGVHSALRLQALQIEAFRLRHGRIPSSLDEIPAHLPGIRLVRSNSRVYQLVAAAPTGETVVYDSARPDPVFDGILEQWTSEAGS